MSTDPFSDPTPRVSAFASADSFRGRVIMIEPTKIERNVPKQPNVPNGPAGDRVTATVTVLDGKGPVEIYAQRVPTGRMLDGPEHIGVWFNQDQLASGLQTPKKDALLSRVLCVIDTFKPGTQAGQGNPWTMRACTAEEKALAVQQLAEIQLAATSAPADSDNPF